MTDQQHDGSNAQWAAPGAAHPYAGQPAHPYAGQPAIPYAGQSAYPVGAPWGPLANWGQRVGAMLIDSLLSMIGLIPYVVGIVLFVVGARDSGGYDSVYTDVYEPPTPGNTGQMLAGGVLAVVGALLMLGIQIWNRAFKQGRTGQSVGKKVVGLKLVEERTGQPMGAGMAFVRDLAHTLDGLAYIGYLWPLWDPKRQTFADMVMSTVVVRVPSQQG